MELTAQKRGSGKMNKLRSEGFIPAVVYNKELNLSITVERRAFDKVFRSQGAAHIINLKVEGEADHDVLVKAVQMDKRRRLPQHVDFYAVTAGQVVEVSIPIEFVGAAKGIKDSGGLMDVQKREVTINILPRLIPEAIHLDIRHLGLGDSLHVSDVLALLPAEAELLDDPEATLITIVAPRVVSGDDQSGAVDLEPEVIGKGTDEDEDEA